MGIGGKGHVIFRLSLCTGLGYLIPMDRSSCAAFAC